MDGGRKRVKMNAELVHKLLRDVQRACSTSLAACIQSVSSDI